MFPQGSAESPAMLIGDFIAYIFTIANQMHFSLIGFQNRTNFRTYRSHVSPLFFLCVFNGLEYVFRVRQYSTRNFIGFDRETPSTDIGANAGRL
jgi:hypothetical protein